MPKCHYDICVNNSENNGGGFCIVCKTIFFMIEAKYCIDCGIIHGIKDFNSHKDGFLGKSPVCKSCQSKRMSLRLCIQRMISTNKKNKMINFDLSYNDVESIWKEQKGRCFYSGINMNFDDHCDYKVSISRIDKESGYKKENIILIVQELNIATKLWNKIKLKNLLTNEILDHPQISDIRNKIIVKKLKKSSECRLCGVFYDTINDCCYKCRYHRDINNVLLFTLNNCKNNTKSRNKIKTRDKTECNINIDDMWDQLQSQRGKCFYSDMNMTFNGRRDDWNISIERLDTTKGYEVGNFVFICEEFNSPDRSSIKTLYEKQGSCGWSRDKFIYFKLCALEYNNYYK